MKPLELRVARIGNSRGVRLPAATLERFGIGNVVIMEERSDGILLRPPGAAPTKLSWEDTAAAMAASDEEWTAWDAVAGDGLEGTTWHEGKRKLVAEPAAVYNANKGPVKSRKKAP